MRLLRRLDRIAREKAAERRRCPECSVTVLIDDSAPDPVCGRCGRAVPNIVRIVETVVEADTRGKP